MFKNTPIANVYAFILFVLAKLCAFAGVALGFIPSLYTVGAFMLGTAGLLLIASVVVCVREMNRQNRLEEANKKMKDESMTLIQKMIEDGSLFKEMNLAGFKVQRNE